MLLPGLSLDTRRSGGVTLLLLMSWLIMATPGAHGILINGEGADGVTGIYDRFNASTYPSAPVPNPSFIGAAFDLSGVGWNASDGNQSVTLVSPQYFVLAGHYPLSTGTLKFRGTDGVIYSAGLDSYRTITYTGTDGVQNSDLRLGRLNAPLPAAVHPVPIFYLGATDISTPSSFDPYLGLSLPLFNYGRTGRMGTNTLDDFGEFGLVENGPATTIGLSFDHDAGDGETLLEVGDSGSPTFAFWGGAFGLIGTHSGVDEAGTFSVDAFVSYTEFVEQINDWLDDDNQALTFVTVPEPDAFFFGLMVIGICGLRRFRKAGAIETMTSA